MNLGRVNIKAGVCAALWLLVVGRVSIASAQDSIVGSPHDLSAFGPGSIHAIDEQQVCIFCHAPHNATGQAPLWNRFERDMHYRIYRSSTTDARIDQPSGPSKMCLSCHDGATALGLVASRPADEPIDMTQRTIPPGDSDLTEDLSDDHPIGFRFDRALASRDPQLKNPEIISPGLPLGRHGEMHCTTCHDPHNNRLGDFLRVTDRMSTICTSCHEMTGWSACSHAISPRPVVGRTVDPREVLPHGTVAENGCTNCHKIHSAEGSRRLLRFAREEDNCLNCHSGGGARTNVASEFQKRSVHPVRLSSRRHDPAENPRTSRRHVECADCHNPHAVMPVEAEVRVDGSPALVGRTMQFVSGVDRTGNPLRVARFEYEVCLKCHGDSLSRPRTGEISRQITQTDTRLEFDTGNPSFHPVFGPRNNRDVVSLIPPMRVGSVISCTDCHASDSPGGPGSTEAAGPHGSIHEPLLRQNYTTRDFTVESPQAYSLCYQCHDRQSILSDESFPLHSTHIVKIQAPCSACHDAHGISRTQGNDSLHSSLINFDLNIVRPAGSGLGPRVEYVDRGNGRGSCTLTCHSVTHINFEYER